MIFWATRFSQAWLAVTITIFCLFHVWLEGWEAGARQFVVFVLVVACVELFCNILILFRTEKKEKQ
jgi:hypothetical protein